MIHQPAQAAALPYARSTARRFSLTPLALAALCITAPALAQQPAWLDPGLAPAARAADLVQRMTREEKAAQQGNDARACTASPGPATRPCSRRRSAWPRRGTRR
jgi:hypothetical protein